MRKVPLQEEALWASRCEGAGQEASATCKHPVPAAISGARRNSGRDPKRGLRGDRLRSQPMGGKVTCSLGQQDQPP